MQSENKQLLEAFTAEAVAAARYEVLALKARKDGNTAQARLYSALARALDIHARKALMILRGKAEDPAGDLERTLAERAGARDRARRVAAEADGAAAAILSQFHETAEGHATIVKHFSDGVDASLSVCQICGYVAEHSIPSRCPVCNAVREKFETVE